MENSKRKPINWRSRIVKSGKIKASELCPHPNNPVDHPPLQRDTVAASFDELGQIDPVKVNINNGYIVDGHERAWLAQMQPGDVELDCVWVDLTEEEHLKALVYLRATGELAVYQPDILDDILRQINSDSEAIQMMLSNLAAQTGLIPPDNPYDEWVGMPEFTQDGVSPYSVQVHFNTIDDMQKFAVLIQQTVTTETKHIYYPAKIYESMKPYRVQDES